MDMVDINTNYPGSTKYSINLFRGITMIVTKDLLKSRNVPGIGFIPISSEGYIKKSNNLTPEKMIISCFQKHYHLYNSN